MIKNRLWLLYVVLSLISFSSFSWEYEDSHEPEIAEIASSIASEIEKFPDALFMTSEDKSKVSQLLQAVISEQSVYADTFSADLKLYYKDEVEWDEITSTWLTLNSLGKSKEKLLALAPGSAKEQITGFGPSGVLQFQQEWQITQLNAEFLLIAQIRSFRNLVSDILISPIPVIWAALQVLFVYFALLWWLNNNKRLINLFRSTQLDVNSRPPIWVRLFWYVSKANVPIAWLVAITVSLRTLAEIPSLSQLIVLEIFTWWVLGGSIAISFILEFTYRNSRAASKDITALRLSTVRRYVWSFIAAGVILQISERTLGKATIYAWIYTVVAVWFIAITLLVLRKWKPVVFGKVAKMKDKPVWITWTEKKQNAFLFGLLSNVAAIGWIAYSTVQHTIVSTLSKFTIFSQGLAYLFKIEVAKQNSTEATTGNMVRVKGDEAFKYVLPGHEDSELIEFAKPELNQISKYVMSDNPAVCIVSGERGVGSTTFLKQLLHKVKNATPIYVTCPYSGYSGVLQQIAQVLGLEDDASEIQILGVLRKSNTTYLIAVDNAQRLVKPMVGGLSDLIKLTNLLRRSKKNHRAVLSIEKSSWRFVDRARGERLLFDLVTFLPKWTESQVSTLLQSRINQSENYRVSFEGLVVPKQWDHEGISEEERARKGFYRILWHYADGNPTVALRFFRLSLRLDKAEQKVVVRLFRAPESEELEKMPKPMLAVLRSIVQLEVASQEELSQCTQLSISEVLGTLRYFQSRGYIEWSEDKARISDHWFRHITNVLHRQHLLVK